MTKGFYFYLTMLVFVVFLLGSLVAQRIDGDQSIRAFDLIAFFAWAVGAGYSVIDEYRLKEIYAAAEKERT